MSTSAISTNGVHNATDEAIDSLYSFWPGTTPPPPPCPEARFSCTLRGTLGGVETLLTVRGMTAAEFKANLEKVRGLLDAPQPVNPPPPPASGQEKGWCHTHQVPMQRHENAKGVWYSHFVDGKHCKGRP